MRKVWFLFLLAGCYDFEGEAGRLGFRTDHLLAPAQAWTPEYPLLEGSRVTVFASQRIGADEDAELHETGSVSGGLRRVTSEDNQVVFEGERPGRVWFDGDARDSFKVRWAPATGAVVAPLGVDGGDPFAVPVGVPCSIAVSLTDARGELLGYRADDLTVDAQGPATVSFHDGLPTLTGSAPGDVALTIGILSTDLTVPPVRVADDDDVVSLELVGSPLADGRTMVDAIGRLEDGTPVACLPVAWSGDLSGSDGAIAGVEAGGTVTAAWGDLRASLTGDSP